MKNNYNLEAVPTCFLVEELSKREGVATEWVEPYVDTKVEVSDPAIVLTVID